MTVQNDGGASAPTTLRIVARDDVEASRSAVRAILHERAAMARFYYVSLTGAGFEPDQALELLVSDFPMAMTGGLDFGSGDE